ncbi:SPOR domain-containing protein [Mariprofundus ferrooxydans]|uniref:SPOR domain-containing protein n=1 Tax=Mariprofundus ferrooxydans TaxID=314344 RepID=UPI00037DD174|nr:SPOR domain-containing protein [Mariprofundus ferrooxydans]
MDDKDLSPQQDAAHAPESAPHDADDDTSTSAEALFTQMQEAFQPLQQGNGQSRELPDADNPAADEPIEASDGSTRTRSNNGRKIALAVSVGAIALVAGLYIASLPDSGDRPASRSVATTSAPILPADHDADEKQESTAQQPVVTPETQMAASGQQPSSGSESSDSAMNDTPATLPDKSPVDAPVVSDDISHATEAASTAELPSSSPVTPHLAETRSPQTQAAVTPDRQAAEPSSRIAVNDALDPANTGEQHKGAMATLPAQKQWVINLASFLDAAAADRMLARLRDDGLACAGTEVTIAGTVWHRIYLPGFSTVHQATKPMQELSDRYGIKGAWIGKAPAAE